MVLVVYDKIVLNISSSNTKIRGTKIYRNEVILIVTENENYNHQSNIVISIFCKCTLLCLDYNIFTTKEQSIDRSFICIMIHFFLTVIASQYLLL